MPISAVIKVMHTNMDLVGTQIQKIMRACNGYIYVQKRLPPPYGDYQPTIKTLLSIKAKLAKKFALDQNIPSDSAYLGQFQVLPARFKILM